MAAVNMVASDLEVLAASYLDFDDAAVSEVLVEVHQLEGELINFELVHEMDVVEIDVVLNVVHQVLNVVLRVLDVDHQD